MTDPRRSADRGFQADLLPRPNPFATRFVAPGRLPWLPDEATPDGLDRLAARLVHDLSSRGAIVGPHGTGKSTLMEHLATRLGGIHTRFDAGGRQHVENEAGRVVWVQLRVDGSPRRVIRQSRSLWAAGRVLMIDGFEQLDLLGRIGVSRATRATNMGLVVTRHRSGRLPELCRTTVSPHTAKQIVERLIESEVSNRPWLERLADESGLAERLRRQHGNFREVLMELFDEVQTYGRPAPRETCTRPPSRSQ